MIRITTKRITLLLLRTEHQRRHPPSSSMMFFLHDFVCVLSARLRIVSRATHVHFIRFERGTDWEDIFHSSRAQLRPATKPICIHTLENQNSFIFSSI